MSDHNFQIRQLSDELQPPESGKKSVVLTDDENAKVVLLVFAGGAGLAEHIAPLPAIIQIIELRPRFLALARQQRRSTMEPRTYNVVSRLA